MDHRIVFVEDLPEGHDFLLVETADKVVIFYRSSAVTTVVLEDSWSAFRALTPRPMLVAV